jgi:hypothetical protein
MISLDDGGDHRVEAADRACPQPKVRHGRDIWRADALPGHDENISEVLVSRNRMSCFGP